MIITKKIQVIVDGDKEEVSRVYAYLRDGMYAQNTAYNILSSRIYASYLLRESDEARKEIYKRGSRKKNSNKGPSLYDDFDNINFPVGLGTPGAVGFYVKRAMKEQIKKGLLKGHISLRNMKLDSPLIIPNGSFFSIQSEYQTEEEIKQAAASPNFDVYIKFVNGIRFKIVFGNPYKSADLRDSIVKLLCGQYRALGSLIQIDGKKIYFLMSIDIGKKETAEKDENISVGCHFGFRCPILCCTNDSVSKVQVIGNTESFVAQRLRMQTARNQLQHALRYAKGGRGRKRKLRALEYHKNREQNFAKTCNHQWTSAVIKYALSKNAKYINLEVRNSKDLDNYMLRNWNYFMFKTFLAYKAEKNGLEVRYVILPSESSKESDEGVVQMLAHASQFVNEKDFDKETESKNEDIKNYGEVMQEKKEKNDKQVRIDPDEFVLLTPTPQDKKPRSRQSECD